MKNVLAAAPPTGCSPIKPPWSLSCGLSLQQPLRSAQSTSNSTHGSLLSRLWFRSFDLIFFRAARSFAFWRQATHTHTHEKEKKNPPSCQLAHQRRHRLLAALWGDAIRNCEPVVTRRSLVLINNKLPQPSSYLSSSFLGGRRGGGGGRGTDSTAWIYIFLYLFAFVMDNGW